MGEKKPCVDITWRRREGQPSAGVALDALVGELLMGDRRLDPPVCDSLGLPRFRWKHCGELMEQPPAYSSDIAAAWEVVAKLRAATRLGGVPCDLCVRVTLGDVAFADVYETAGMGYVGYNGPLIDASVEAATVPLAICLAALVAAGQRGEAESMAKI